MKRAGSLVTKSTSLSGPDRTGAELYFPPFLRKWWQCDAETNRLKGCDPGDRRDIVEARKGIQR